MFYGIIATLFSSLDTILWKKSLDLNKMSTFNFGIIGYTGDFIVSFFIITLGYLNFELLLDYKLLGIILFLILLGFIKILLNNKIYKNEKVSNLIPYENLDKVFVIIISFFIFSDVSVLSFVITFFIILLIVLFSIDLKNISFPRNYKLIILLHIINAIKLLIIGYLLFKISNLEYFSIFSLLFFIISIIIIIYNKNYKELKTGTKEFYNYRFGASAMGVLSDLIGLFVISSFGLIMSILLGFFGLFSSLLLSYFILKDKPSKKNIILAFIVIGLIGIGYYFK